MNRIHSLVKTLPVPAILAATLLGCAGRSREPSPAGDPAFDTVRFVLETNCVHCHGDNRLSNMPPINDTRALRSLASSPQWIVPGQPEKSRFYQVVVFPDNVPGAMPPTGHAISKREIQVLHDWIRAGATVPAGRVRKLSPRGDLPRST